MKITCTNLRKTDIIKVDDVGNSKTAAPVLNFMNTILHVAEIHFFPATLTNEYAQFMVVLNGDFKKKKYLTFKSQSWLVGVSDDADDDKAVEKLNNKVLSLLNQLEVKPYCHNDDLSVHARIHGTTVMNPLTFGSSSILCPNCTYYLKQSDIDVIFCERVTSYTKSFDLTFVLKNKTVHTHSCIDRKRINELKKWATIQFFETGPDPIPWKQMFNYQKDSSWKEIHELITAVPSDDDDDDDEWVEDEDWDEEDDDFDEYVDDDFDEYEDYESSPKKRKY